MKRVTFITTSNFSTNAINSMASNVASTYADYEEDRIRP